MRVILTIFLLASVIASEKEERAIESNKYTNGYLLGQSLAAVDCINLCKEITNNNGGKCP